MITHTLISIIENILADVEITKLCCNSSILSKISNLLSTLKSILQISKLVVTKTMVYAILCGMVHIKDPLLLIRKNSSSGFPLHMSDVILPKIKCVECVDK